MAEITLQINDGPNHDEGDVWTAYSDRRISQVHLERLCHPRTARRNSSGLILTRDLHFDFCQLTHQYRFQQVSPTEAIRRDLWTGEEERFGPEYWDLRLFLRRRRQKPDHRIFG